MSSSQANDSRKEILAGARRIVVKLGTAVIMQDHQTVALSRLYSFVETISRLNKSGVEVLLVSSGAVGMGVQHLGLENRPTDLPMIQACAAVGQGQLLSLYSDAFGKMGVKTAQVLLSEEDFSNRKRYLNLRTTISELLKLKTVPIINENDTVSTSEIESISPNNVKQLNFGDNDKLSALVASKIDADLLIILTDVDGLYSANPHSSQDAELISEVNDITPYLVSIEKQLELESKSKKEIDQGRGGIKSKLEAAKIVTQSGIPCIVANGKTQDILGKIFENDEIGTLFSAQKHMAGKTKWIAFATSVKGSVRVNEGAKLALLEKKASLLPAGIMEVKGSYARGDVISIEDADGLEFARGLTNYNSEETNLISGKHSKAIDELIQHRNYDAIITRDNLAFTT